MAEKAIQAVKNLLKKAHSDKQDPFGLQKHTYVW